MTRLPYSLQQLGMTHHWDVASYFAAASKNLDQLLLYVKSIDIQFTVIGLCETWLSENIKDLYGIPEYTSIHECRQDKRGGGVSLFKHRSAEFNVRTELSQFNEYIESTFIELNGKSVGQERNVIVGIIYRPPNTDIHIFNQYLISVLSLIKTENKISYIMGDYNINILNSESHGDTGRFLDIMYSHSFIPLITKPTRITHDSATIIDNIFTNDIAYSKTLMHGILYTDISDHFPVFAILKSNVCNTQLYIKKRCFNEEKNNLFKKQLSETNWDFVLSQDNTQTAYSMFTNRISSLYQKAFPLKNVCIGNKPYNPWITEGIKNSIRYKNKLYFFIRKKIQHLMK